MLECLIASIPNVNLRSSGFRTQRSEFCLLCFTFTSLVFFASSSQMCGLRFVNGAAMQLVLSPFRNPSLKLKLKRIRTGCDPAAWSYSSLMDQTTWTISSVKWHAADAILHAQIHTHICEASVLRKREFWVVTPCSLIGRYDLEKHSVSIFRVEEFKPFTKLRLY
jgi:hypothetical protein